MYYFGDRCKPSGSDHDIRWDPEGTSITSAAAFCAGAEPSGRRDISARSPVESVQDRIAEQCIRERSIIKVKEKSGKASGYYYTRLHPQTDPERAARCREERKKAEKIGVFQV